MMVVDCPMVSYGGRYSIAQAAKVLDVHRNTIERWLKAGMFKPSEYNKRRSTRRVFITGAGIVRVWSQRLY